MSTIKETSQYNAQHNYNNPKKLTLETMQYTNPKLIPPYYTRNKNNNSTFHKMRQSGADMSTTKTSKPCKEN